MARFISIKVVGGADAFEDGQHLLNTDSVITVTSGDEAGANEGTKTTIHTSFTQRNEDQAVYNEIMRQSALSYVPAAVIMRENLKIRMKENNGSLSLT